MDSRQQMIESFSDCLKELQQMFDAKPDGFVYMVNDGRCLSIDKDNAKYEITGCKYATIIEPNHVWPDLIAIDQVEMKKMHILFAIDYSIKQVRQIIDKLSQG